MKGGEFLKNGKCDMEGSLRGGTRGDAICFWHVVLLIMQLPAFTFDFFYCIPDMLPSERHSHKRGTLDHGKTNPTTKIGLFCVDRFCQ